MSAVQDIFKTHPHPTDMDTTFLSDVAEEIFACAQTCTACSDDCLGEEDVPTLKRCIRMCLDCGDTCVATGRLVSRQTESDPKLLKGQLEACITALQICAEECDRHASQYEHCRVCAEICHHCEKVCSELHDKMAA